MKKETLALAAIIKSANVDNDAKVIMGTALFAGLNDKRAKLEDFLGACGCYRERVNLLSRLPIKVAYGTPIYCDPSSETYHCM